MKICEKMTKIMYYDIIVEKCSNSNIIMLSYNDINDLVTNIMRFHNVGDYKKYTNLLQVDKFDRKIMDTFKKDFCVGDEFIPNKEKQCYVCEQNLLKISFNNSFIFYFCQYCGRIFIDQNKFDEYIQNSLNKLKKYYILKKIKRFLHLN